MRGNALATECSGRHVRTRHSDKSILPGTPRRTTSSANQALAQAIAVACRLRFSRFERQPLPMCDDTARALVLALARYLVANPDASDTAAGIARWWLPAGADRRSLAMALDWLNERGFIEMIQAADGHVRYRRSDRSASGDAALCALVASPDARHGSPH